MNRKAMTQTEITAAKTAAVVAHGAVVATRGFGDAIIFTHADGAEAYLTWDDRKQVKGWVFSMLSPR